MSGSDTQHLPGCEARMKSLLEVIGLAGNPIPPERIRILQPLVRKEPNGKRQGTPAYKNGLTYIYCTPEDKRICKRLAIDQGVTMIELLHKLLSDADVVTPDPRPVIPADVRIMKASEFFEQFVFGPMERWEQQKQEKSGDKK